MRVNLPLTAELLERLDALLEADEQCKRSNASVEKAEKTGGSAWGKQMAALRVLTL
jgi:hypothetical protein